MAQKQDWNCTSGSDFDAMQLMQAQWDILACIPTVPKATSSSEGSFWVCENERLLWVQLIRWMITKSRIAKAQIILQGNNAFRAREIHKKPPLNCYSYSLPAMKK